MYSSLSHTKHRLSTTNSVRLSAGSWFGSRAAAKRATSGFPAHAPIRIGDVGNLRCIEARLPAWRDSTLRGYSTRTGLRYLILILSHRFFF